MSRNYNLYQIDSFTKAKFSGNPAGVITNSDGLTDYEMQRIARELNNSETAFSFCICILKHIATLYFKTCHSFN